MENEIKVDKTSKEYIKARRRKYYQEHKEMFKRCSRKWEEANPDKVKLARKKHYETHKEQVLEQNREYIKNNRAKVTQLVIKRRKEVAAELAQKGQIYTYLPKTERESKMCQSLAKKMNCDIEKARNYLEDFDWNYKEIVERLKKCICCGEIDIEEYGKENQDGWYCDLCWISKD